MEECDKWNRDLPNYEGGIASGDKKWNSLRPCVSVAYYQMDEYKMRLCYLYDRRDL